MKNPFLIASAIVSTTYPAALAAQVIGLLPTSIMSFPAFIGFFTVAGVLALAVCDYSRTAPSYETRRVRRRKPMSERRIPAMQLQGTEWMHHTVSS